MSYQLAEEARPCSATTGGPSPPQSKYLKRSSPMSAQHSTGPFDVEIGSVKSIPPSLTKRTIVSVPRACQLWVLSALLLSFCSICKSLALTLSPPAP